ncbi:hypothetical protein N9B43_03415 [Mariniblastus sp.]|nr:hypothetical protein [Mariniblastus sp.]
MDILPPFDCEYKSPDWMKPDWMKPDWMKPDWMKPDWMKPIWSQMKPEFSSPRAGNDCGSPCGYSFVAQACEIH